MGRPYIVIVQESEIDSNYTSSGVRRRKTSNLDWKNIKPSPLTKFRGPESWPAAVFNTPQQTKKKWEGEEEEAGHELKESIFVMEERMFGNAPNLTALLLIPMATATLRTRLIGSLFLLKTPPSMNTTRLPLSFLLLNIKYCFVSIGEV